MSCLLMLEGYQMLLHPLEILVSDACGFQVRLVRVYDTFLCFNSAKVQCPGKRC